MSAIILIGSACAEVPTMVSKKYVNDIIASLDNKFVKKTDIANSVNPNQEIPVTSKAVYNHVNSMITNTLNGNNGLISVQVNGAVVRSSIGEPPRDCYSVDKYCVIGLKFDSATEAFSFGWQVIPRQ